jgi:hypothetical protein
MAAADLPALNTVRAALQQALGMTFEGDKGEHFFRSTLVQTLFYGVFSAWVLWHRSHAGRRQRFDWDQASRYLHVPILRKLCRELADPFQLNEWKLAEVLDWTAGVLNRVDRAAFFAKFRDAEAVQYFYEPFLEAFDPELRKQLGVWYTPPEIVRYMVARVDTVLREDLGRPDGLADPDVYILDPCCGTGAYLVEVLRTIARALKDRGEEALLGGKLKDAAVERLFGFEILPAPFVVAHLQMGLFLQSEGVPLEEARSERAGVYLTNAMTGWQPPKEPKRRYLFAEMEEEHDRAEAVKLRTPVLVVLGNPPYNGFAGVAVDEERDLTDAYRGKPGDPSDLKPQGQGLNDLYVRFFRMAERCIVEGQAGHGIVCFISNYSWLDGLSFPIMRERYLKEFDSVWIDCLNGDKYRTGKLTPEGKPDPSVFSTEHNREGIQVGTAVALLVRRAQHGGPAVVRFRDLWGQTKREDLLASLLGFSTGLYQELRPARPLGLPFRPLDTESHYLSWPKLPDLFPQNFPGVQTKQDALLVDIDRPRLLARMTDYFDAGITNETLAERHDGAMDGTHACEPVSTRAYLVKRGFLPEFVVRFLFRPFDLRWIYWEPETKLLGRRSPDYYPQIFPENVWLAAVHHNRKDFDPPLIASRLCCLHVIERSANMFPLLLRELPEKPTLAFETAPRKLSPRDKRHFNISDVGLKYLESVGGLTSAPLLFYHAGTVLHAAAYAADNTGALRRDWPRVPLPVQRARLEASAALGRQVAALLDTEAPVLGVTAGKIRPELLVIGRPTRVGGGSLKPAAGELDVTARWGIAGKGGVTMPSTGRVAIRDYTPEEKAAIIQGAAALGLDEATALACLGDSTVDVFLNDVAYWRNVPARVWEYTLGGYQVMKKWLSYREKALLGRGLTLDEVSEVANMGRRIAALLLLQPALDANYRAVKTATYPWRASAGKAGAQSPQ